MTYDLIIIGGGPGGVAAGVYAARKRLKTLFITDTFGGQSTDSETIQNWIGTVAISGIDFGKALKKHLESYASDSVSIHETEKVLEISKNNNLFSVKTNKGNYESKTVLIATGSHRRKLEIPGAKEYEGKGIVYCASCDAPLFGDKDVVIIGGGNAAFDAATQLLAYAKSVTLLNRSDMYKADPETIKKVLSNPRMKAMTNVAPIEIKGNKFVTGIVYENKETGEKIEMPVSGVFVEIGLLPTTDFVKNIVKLNNHNQIPVNPKNQKTEVDGLWAAGDCTDGLYHQNNIAAGDAIKAIEDIYGYLGTNN